jgi:hypothetical protein
LVLLPLSQHLSLSHHSETIIQCRSIENRRKKKEICTVGSAQDIAEEANSKRLRWSQICQNQKKSGGTKVEKKGAFMTDPRPPVGNASSGQKTERRATMYRI